MTMNKGFSIMLRCRMAVGRIWLTQAMLAGMRVGLTNTASGCAGYYAGYYVGLGILDTSYWMSWANGISGLSIWIMGQSRDSNMGT